MTPIECTKCLTEVDPSLINDKINLIAPYIPHDFFLQAEKEPCCFFDHRVRQIEGCILYTDITGFTPIVSSISEKGHAGNEKLQEILADYYTELIGAIKSFGGSVYQFAGDSILAGFSLYPGESAAANIERALAAVDLFSRKLIRFENIRIGASVFSLRSSIGISFGTFHQIILGTKELWCSPVYTGTPVNNAIDAERASDDGEVLVHRETAAMLPDKFPNVHSYKSYVKYIPSAQNIIAGKGHISPGEYCNPRLYKRCSYLIKPLLFERVIGGFAGFNAEHREVTCLLVKFDGIDYHTDINSAADSLNMFFEFVQKESARYGGIFLQTDLSDKGNVFFILFGALRAQENKEILAVDLALNITQEIKRFPSIQHIQAGVATGSAYCGDIGAPFRKDYTVVGPVINLASRLMTCSDSTGVFIDAATESKTIYNFIKEKAEILTVKGFTSPISAYRITGKIKRYRGRTITYKDKMIGRQDEYNSLLERIKKSLSGKGCITAVTGEAGIGKTRLIDSLLDELKHTGGEPSIGRCYPYEHTTIYYPWRELLNLFFQLFEYHSNETRIKIVSAALEQIFGSGYPERLESIAELLGINYSAGIEHNDYDAHHRQDFLFSTVYTILRWSAEKYPQILVFEDIHWIDEKSLRLLEYVAERIESASICILITSRPETSYGRLTSLDTFEILHLPQLSDDEALSLIRTMLNLSRPDPALEAHILSSSGKNPFFIESIIHNLYDNGMISTRSGERRFDGSFENIAAPRTLHDLVLTRIDSLTINEQLIIKSSSVIGRVFGYDALKILLPDMISTEECDAAIRKFCSMEIIAQVADNPPVYTFKHITVRDVLYNTLLQATREQLHQILAFYFERRDKDAIHDNLEKLAYHFIQARDTEKGIHYTLLAAEKARTHFANRDATTFYRSALDLILQENAPVLIPVAYEIKLKLAEVQRLSGNYGEAELLYKDCLSWYTDVMTKADILIGIGSVYQETARPLESIAEMEKALKLLRCRPPGGLLYTYVKLAQQTFLRLIYDRFRFLERPFRKHILEYEKQAQLLWVLSKIYFLQRKEKVAWATLTMYNITRRLNNDYYLSLAAGNLAMTLAGMGRIEQSVKFFEQAHHLAVTSHHPLAEAVSLSRKGFYNMFTDHPSVSIEQFSRSVELFKKTGEKWEYFSAMGGLGQSYFSISDFIRAETVYRELGDAALDVKNPLHAGWMFTRVSFCRYLVGINTAQIAKELLGVGINISEKANDLMNLLRSYGHLATIAVYEKNAEDAAEFAEKIWEANKKYTVIMPHVKLSLLFASEAALFALTHGAKNHSKRRLQHIARRSVSILTSLAEIFTQLKGPALLSEARYYAYRQDSDYTVLYFSAALAVLADSSDIWLTACAYRDAALSIPEKKTEYLLKALSLFTDCHSAVDVSIIKSLLESDPR